MVVKWFQINHHQLNRPETTPIEIPLFKTKFILYLGRKLCALELRSALVANLPRGLVHRTGCCFSGTTNTLGLG